MKILITGGAGYIGDVAVEFLLKKCHEVIVVDNLMYGQNYLRQHKNLKFVRGDITDKQLMGDLIFSVDSVLHLAAIVGDGACAANFDRASSVNLQATRHIAEQCKMLGRRLVFASTCSVYGKNESLLDECSITNPLSHYAGTKLEAEKAVRLCPKHHIFRLGTLFGLSTPHARLRSDLVANILTYKAATGEKLTVFGGEQYRPLLHVRDAGELMAFAAMRTTNALTGGGSYGTNILMLKNSTIIDLARLIARICDLGEDGINVTNMPFEDQRNYRISSEHRGSWWIKRFSLEDGIKEMVDVAKEGRIADIWGEMHHNAKYSRSLL